MRKHIGYNLAIALFSALSVLFAVLLVLSLFPARHSLDISVKESVRVSSSADGDGDGYRTQLRGVIVNEGDEEITLRALRIVVGDGSREKVLEVKALTLAPRVPVDLSDAASEWESDAAYDRVLSVTAVTEEGEAVLSSNTAGFAVDLTALLWGVLLLIAVLLTVHFSKQRYYLAEEDRMKTE